MLLSKLLSRTTFDSYADFKKNYELRVPARFNFARDVVDAWAEADPRKRALVWLNDRGERREFTFAEISELSKKAANYLSSLGLKKGDRVLTLLKRNWQYWVTAVACHRMGVVIIPASVQLATKDIVYRVNFAGIRAIIATDDEWSQGQVEEAAKQCTGLDYLLLARGGKEGWLDYDRGIAEAPAEFKMPEIYNTDILLSYFTSGTTGMPKMVLHNHSYPLAHIQTAIFWHNVQSDGIHFTVSDSGWGKCLWGKFYGQWFGETTVFVYEFDKFEPQKMLQVMQDYKITTFCAPPTIYRYFIKEDLSKFDLSSLCYATTAGEALNPEVFDQFKRATGIDIKEAFGQTETTAILGNFVCMKGQKGSLGRPSPLYKVDIVDENGESCPPGETGEIAIHTDRGTPYGLFMCYYKDEELTRKAWHDGIYRTGDLAWRDEKGYYWYVGRADDVIKSSGYRIGPFEVESALMEHPAVLETGITGVPHPERGQVIKATIVLAPGYVPSEELKRELQDHVKKATAPYKYPRVIEFVDELPKTISGKIKRFEIRNKDAGQTH